MSVEEQLTRFYDEAKNLYERTSPRLGAAASGYEIMYGPPIMKPPMLLIGFQPGGDNSDVSQSPVGSNDGRPWPSISEYGDLNQKYRLAINMRKAFGQQFLAACTGLNVIFLRASGQGSYTKMVPLDVRREFEALGKRVSTTLVETLRPRLILFLGFKSMETFTSSKNVVLRSGKGRSLLAASAVAGVPAFGMLHPTGARPSNEDLGCIGRFIIGQIGSEAVD